MVKDVERVLGERIAGSVRYASLGLRNSQATCEPCSYNRITRCCMLLHCRFVSRNASVMADLRGEHSIFPRLQFNNLEASSHWYVTILVSCLACLLALWVIFIASR